MPGIHIEQHPPGTVSIERVLAVLRRLAPGFNPPLDKQLDLAAYAAKISTLAEITFAVQNATDLGLAALYANEQSGRYAFLTMLAVSPERMRERLGTRLLLHAIEIAAVHGMESIRLEVSESNRAALHFYSKFGFVPAPKPCSTHGPQPPGILLERSCKPLPLNRRFAQ